MRENKTAGTGSGDAPEAPVSQAQPSPAATAFAAEARDLNALRNAVVDAASVGAGLWLSYLFVLFYLLIAVGSVTHRNLLFENPVKLPFLNVDLPLTGFFVLGPGLFLIVHAYVLLHFVLLAGKVGVFHTELQAQIADENARARLRRQLPSNIFVQFLAGPVEVRTGIMGALLRGIAWISLVAGPLALLVFFQLQFLPYHHEAITWWQRAAVVIDLVLLWTLWPSVVRGEAISDAWRNVRRWWVAAAVAASTVPVSLVFTIATFPGERLDRHLPPLSFVPTRWPSLELAHDRTTPRLLALVKSMDWTSPHKLLVLGDVDFIARKPTSLWSNRLVLPGIDVIDQAKFDTDEKIAAVPETFSLRGRRLEGAVLIGARLRKVDFTAAQLQGADFTGADLQDAKFLCAERKLQAGVDAASQRSAGDLRCTDLQEVRLLGAQLDGATFVGAKLHRAMLGAADLRKVKFGCKESYWKQDEADEFSDTQFEVHCTQFWHASLMGANLHGTTLLGVQLQAALLDRADLREAKLGYTDNYAKERGAIDDKNREEHRTIKLIATGFEIPLTQLQQASLRGAQLQGIMLDDAQLQGVMLDGAQLQGAWLNGAQLQGAWLNGAQLQGAWLNGAQLQGALLVNAQLQGVSLDGAQLQGALLVDTDFQGVSLVGAGVEGALFSDVFAWRTDARETKGKGVRAVEIQTDPRYFARSCVIEGRCDWSATIFTALKQLIERQVPKGDRRVRALRQIAILDPAVALKGQKEMTEAWGVLAQSSPLPDVHEQSLAALWHETGCKPDGAPYVIHGLLRNLRDGLRSISIDGRIYLPASRTTRFLESGNPERAALAAKFLDEANCAGASGLSEEDKIELRVIRDGVRQPSYPR